MLVLPTAAFAEKSTKSPHAAGPVTYSVAAEPADNNVAGAMTLLLEPTYNNGSLSAEPALSPSDPWDIYTVHLTAGQKFYASMTGAGGTDFDLFLFPPGTTDVDTQPYVWDSSNTNVYPEQFTYVAPVEGDYYLGVNAFEGIGTYVMLANVATADPDDQIPAAGGGVVLPTSPVTGTLNRYSDQDDVYKIMLSGVGKVKYELSGPAAADFDVYVYSPDKTSVFSDTPMASSDGFTSSESGSFEATTTGWHYIDIYSAFGSGDYSFKYMVGQYTKLSMLTAPVIAYNGTASISGALTTVEGDAPVGNARVTLEARPVGSSTWTPADETTTTLAGGYEFAHKPAAATDYRVQYAGEAGVYTFVTSDVVRVAPKVYLTRPSTPSHAHQYVKFTSVGYLRPRHSSGSHVVKIYAQRYEHGRWVTRKSFSTTTSTYNATTSRYSARFSLPYTGKWRLMSRYAATSKYAATDSVFRYVTVYR